MPTASDRARSARISSTVTVSGWGVSSKSAKSKPGETTHATQGRTVGGGLCCLPFAAVDQILATGAELAHEVRHRRVSPSADGQANRPAALPEPQLVRRPPGAQDDRSPGSRRNDTQVARRSLTSAGRHQLGMPEALAVPPTLRVPLHSQRVRVGDLGLRRAQSRGDGNRPPRRSTRGRVAPTLGANARECVHKRLDEDLGASS